MKAWYNPKPNCYLCNKSGTSFCEECTKLRQLPVKVLSLGNGDHGNMGVIEMDDGKLLSVHLSTLRVMHEGEE